MNKYDELNTILGDDWALAGVNENGEDVILQKFDDESIMESTMQKNGWIRKVTYYIDGTIDETYER